MIYLTNPRFLTLWKSLRLEVADSGLAQVDTTWNMVNVCSPIPGYTSFPTAASSPCAAGKSR